AARHVFFFSSRRRHTSFSRDWSSDVCSSDLYGARLVGGCCGTTTEHVAAIAEAVRDTEPVRRTPEVVPSISSVYQAVPFQQDASILNVGERTNANGSKAFREAMLEQRYDDCCEIDKSQNREAQHV